MANHRSLIRSEERRRNRSKRTSRLHPTRPRLVIYRSLKHLEAQIIDDFKGLTLVSASSKDKNLQTEIKKVKNKTEMSEVVGKAIAKKAISEKIESVVLDRNGSPYHGRVKAFAEAARNNGLKL
tara:strand:- start:15266 stop:15637 length:372 start_codon:yes stop_codon:yes gene_type:complete